MSSIKESTQYRKTALSDLQGSWQLLRDTVVEDFGFPDSDSIMFHIDEAMSWECVRDLNQMRPLLTIIDNIAKQSDAPVSITECIEDVRRNLEEVAEAMREGEIGD